ncbi:MAG TPA: FAD:protein FMN transferase [Candidatus Limnocylindrales bacterium]|nr:FAD:protein FMN transferase [Candidatus Limnocylindrales bacterium]
MIRWRALGTHVDLLVHRGDHRAARAAVEAVLERVDRTYSRFRPDSELVVLNARAGTTVSLSPLLADALGAAIQAAGQTDGLCDPTIGRALLRIGYDADFATVATGTAAIELRMERVAGWQSLRFDPVARTIRVPAGVELDLGSTGKALAADLAATAAAEAMGRGGVLVSLGGDLAIAGDVPEDGWPVLAADDSSIEPRRGGEVIAVRGGAIATSSTTVRTWRRASVVVHHLIDPRTGLPARSPWRTVSVAAATCVDANAAATAGLIRGADAPAWLDGLGLAARLVSTDGDVIRVGGWPVPEPARERDRSREHDPARAGAAA